MSVAHQTRLEKVGELYPGIKFQMIYDVVTGMLI